jgi:anti-sigma factor RsiW
MAMSCEKVRQALESFYDNELHGEELNAVERHLDQCEDCSNELRKLQKAGEMLRSHYEKVAASADLSDVWNRVNIATIELSQPEPLRERLVRVFSVPKPAWAAVGIVALVIIGVLSYLPGDRISTFAANDCIIDSVESQDYSVMVYEVGDTGMKVIWLMEQQSEIPANGTGATT